MHPPSICHRDVDYNLQHLQQIFGDFEWEDRGDRYRFNTRIRFGNHCYSRELAVDEVQHKGDFVVPDKQLRVFCPDRYQQTHVLNQVFANLLVKPTTRVAMTHEKNYTIFKLYAVVGAQQETYRMFFNVKPGKPALLADGSHQLDVFVESAYLKENRVGIRRHLPFGNAAIIAVT